MNKLSITTTLIIAAIAACLATSCRKNKSTAPATPKGMFYLHINSNIDTTEVTSGATATDASGRRIKLNIAAFYISGITLRKANGGTVVLPNAYVLKQMGQEAYYIDSVIAGDYVSISFNVGVDAAANITNPSSYPSTSPLADKSPVMWFGTPSQGYIFMSLSGLTDTTASQTGAVNFPFNYRTGTSSMLRSVTLPDKAFTVVANQPATVRLTADFGKALNGVIFKGSTTATPWINTSVVSQIANNIPTMFRYE